MKRKLKIIMLVIVIILILIGILAFIYKKADEALIKEGIKNNDTGISAIVDLTNLTITEESSQNLKVYTIENYDSFVKDYNNNNLPAVYVTKFLFDGVGMYKTYDLDDFVEEGNDLEVETLETTVININTLGTIEFSGEIKKGMIAVNTNNLEGDINLVLNGIKLDTDSKKIPAIYVYNADITYSKCNVTIIAKEGTKNNIKGGKLKKVSLIGSDELSEYSSKYSGEQKTWYETYTNYYGVYTKSEIEKILFATVTADREDLSDGDPYYYYKASGAISSDIDLNFEGKGYLEVVSKNKEGIETKGSLSFSGGTGDYVIKAQDDCLNTTTDNSENDNAHNNLTIDVNSLVAIVDLEADEGDAIDSNGTLTINGGTIIAIAKPGQDAGLDSEKGTYINGGTVIATGDMYDQISSESEQNFCVLSFGESVKEDTLIVLVNEKQELIFAYKTDRIYANLIYSSVRLKEGTYSLYKDGEITGEEYYGVYSGGTYSLGTQLGYTSTGMQGGPGGMGGGPQMPNGENGTPPEKPDGENTMTPPDGENGTPPERPDGENTMTPPDGENGTPPEKLDGENTMTPPDGENGTPPELPDGFDKTNMPELPEGIEIPNDENQNGMPQMNGNNQTNATNKDFEISGISNLFSGIAELVIE